MNKKRLLVIFAFLAFALPIFLGGEKVSAGGAAGGGEVSPGPSSSCHSENCFSKNYGAVWYYYRLQSYKNGGWKNSNNEKIFDSNPITHSFNMPALVASGQVRDEVRKVCGKAGGFYFLGYAGHNSSGKSSGWQLGAVNLGMMQGYGGSIRKIGPSSEIDGSGGTKAFGGVSLHGSVTQDKDRAVVISSKKNEKFPTVGYSVRGWANACDEFNRMGRDGKINDPWDKAKWDCEKGTADSIAKNLIWFCAWPEGGNNDPKEETYDGEFYSKSQVKHEKLSEEAQELTDKDEIREANNAKTGTIELAANETQAKVNFSHRIRLVADDTELGYFRQANVGTDYWIEQRINNGAWAKMSGGAPAGGFVSINDLTNNIKDHPKIYNKILGENDQTITVQPDSTVTVCQRISYKPKGFTVTVNDKDQITNLKYDKVQKASQVCVKIHRPKDCPPGTPGCPPCPPGTVCPPSTPIPGSFYSQSGIGSTISNKDSQTQANPYVIKIPYDQEKQVVTFFHRIGSDVNDSVFSTARNAYTRWTVSQTNYQPRTNVSSGTTFMSGLAKDNNTYNTVVNTNSVTVSVSPGSSQTVCQKISYNTKNFTVTQNGAFNPTGNTASSGICIQIYRERKPTRCPLSNYYHTTNYGNTVAETRVKNYNKSGSDWTTSVLAKPSDEIQFRHTLCFGAQAVTSSGRNRYESSRQKSSQLSEYDFPSNTFYLEGHRDDDYLFNRRNLAWTRTIPKADPNPTAFYNTFNPDERYTDYGFRVYSPANSSVSGWTSNYQNEFNCNPSGAGWGEGIMPNAYRIPGFSSRICNSAQRTNTSDVGHEIRQTLHYKDVEAWISHKHDKNSAICKGCESYYDLKEAYEDKYDGTYSGTEPTDNPINLTHLSSVYDAAHSGGGYWGYLEQYCKRQSCENSGYQYRVSTSGCTNDENSNCHDTYSSSAHTSCSPLGWHQGEDTYRNSTTGNGHYYSDWWCHTNQRVISDDKYNAPGRKGTTTTYHADITDWMEQETATVRVPYNFETTVSASIQTKRSDGVVFAGEPVESRFTVAVKTRQNDGVDPNRAYLTITPSNTVVRFIRFTVDKDISKETAENALKGGVYWLPGGPNRWSNDVMQYFRGKGIGADNFAVLNNDSQRPLNGNGELYPLGGLVTSDESGRSFSDAAPDVEPGSKYCVAVGISHADSHGIPDRKLYANEAASGYSMNGASPYWRISNAACHTIAKKPNFQTWGGFYTPGKLTTSQSPKRDSDKPGSVSTDLTTTGKIFGSWSDTLAIANSTIKGFASGATLGYIGAGGADNAKSTDYCRLVPMTIASNRCDNGTSGNAIGIQTNNLLPQILSRFTPSDNTSQPGVTRTINSGEVEYTYYRSSITLRSSQVRTRPSTTRVIEVAGDVTIDDNICAGSSGTCSYTGNNILNLRDRNSDRYRGAEDIPQVIIIAENIKINSNVTQIDAWLFARGRPTSGSTPNKAVLGNINTCVGGPSNADTCDRTIIFNGPVFAKTLTLNRTAGADPGPNTARNGLYGINLADTGSTTPAEIFNLRPDVYYWGFNQSNRLTRATVTYMRELAPRY